MHGDCLFRTSNDSTAVFSCYGLKATFFRSVKVRRTVRHWRSIGLAFVADIQKFKCLPEFAHFFVRKDSCLQFCDEFAPFLQFLSSGPIRGDVRKAPFRGR